MKTMNRVVLLSAFVFLISGCSTVVGYSYAKDPSLVKKWNATIVSIQDQNIYNSTGASWVGNLATVESVGQKVDIVAEDGGKVEIIQPKNKNYTLTAGEHVVYVVDQGRVWVQPVDYPLPPDFSSAQKPAAKP